MENNKNTFERNVVIGLDYGTDSCRAIVIDTAGARELGSAVCAYPRWKRGLYCDPAVNRYRQHPLDYIESLETVVREALARCPVATAERVAALSVDTTASTPVLIDRAGMPLALHPGFAANPDAMFVLWKDHTAVAEAAEINELAHGREPDYTCYSGGTYSAEWVWAKVLHLVRRSSGIRAAAYSWVEHGDWIPALLTGRTRPEEMVRSRCIAGHKALWHPSWGGLPAAGFLEALDPLLAVFRSRLYTETHTCDRVAGALTAEWAGRLGLPAGTLVGVGGTDCHLGAVGAGIRPGDFVRVIGTSTCDILVVPPEQLPGKPLRGICGQVDGSVIPGLIGLEAGQSAFGDTYAWFRDLLAWPLRRLIPDVSRSGELAERILSVLSAEAERLPLTETAAPLLALDWLNGRRSPGNDPNLTGALTGLTLGTSAPMLFRALVEATAFGSRAILECLQEQGLRADRVVAIGGISQKSPLVMQTLADVLGRSIRVARTGQACALGAAMFASVAAGIFPRVEEAQRKLDQGVLTEYRPDPARQPVYDRLYKRYRALGAFVESVASQPL